MIPKSKVLNQCIRYIAYITLHQHIVDTINGGMHVAHFYKIKIMFVYLNLL